MILELVSIGLVGLVAYTLMYGGSFSMTGSSVTQTLNDASENGYQFRDITYQDKPDLMHPDLRNNHGYTPLVKDRGENGIKRAHVQLMPGTSEIVQLHRHDNQYL